MRSTHRVPYGAAMFQSLSPCASLLPFARLSLHPVPFTPVGPLGDLSSLFLSFESRARTHVACLRVQPSTYVAWLQRAIGRIPLCRVAPSLCYALFLLPAERGISLFSLSLSLFLFYEIIGDRVEKFARASSLRGCACSSLPPLKSGRSNERR